MGTGSANLDIGSVLLQAVKERRTAYICAASVAVMAIAVLHAPPVPVLLGCGGSVAVLILIGCVKRIIK
jgi:hypothetical protein